MATIKDIAKATGFSTMTISRYLNNPEKVKPKTQEIIKQAIEEYGYSPNLMARLLVTKRTNIICVYIAGDIDARHPFTLETIMGIGESLGRHGYSMLICRDGYKDKVCDGIIAMGATMEEEKQLMENTNEKAIILFGNSSGQNNCVDINNYKGMQKMAEYIVDSGYRKIAYIGTRLQMRYSHDRYNGFKDYLESKNVELDQNRVIHAVRNDEFHGYKAAKQIIENNEVDIIVCASDALAIGVLRYANEKGISVPDELSVTGFDGLGYEKLVSPNITTMEQPVYEAGCRIADRMVEVLSMGDYGENTKEIYINPILRVNGTTK